MADAVARVEPAVVSIYTSGRSPLHETWEQLWLRRWFGRPVPHRDEPPVHGVALEGIGLSFSSAKESESGEWLVRRCVNLLEKESAGSWRLGRAVKEAHLARLDETVLTPLSLKGDTIPFLAPPRAVVTVLVR